MPNCLNYVVARDPSDADAIWITEVWDSEVSHKASLALPTVRAAVAEAMPMIQGFDSATPTEPIGERAWIVGEHVVKAGNVESTAKRTWRQIPVLHILTLSRPS